MWNPNKSHKQFDEEEDTDESWEVKAFEQDTKANLSGGATWPPRSYSCNFCRREFRSAQALGGHMNVHRRDRATAAALTNNGNAAAAAAARGGGGRGKTFINSCLPTTLIIQSTSTSNSNIIDQGLSHQFYQFQNPSGIFGNSSDLMNLYATSFPPSPPIPPPLSDGETIETSIGDELDLELRLGHKTTIAPPPYNN